MFQVFFYKKTLLKLGAEWSSFDMVLHYTHLNCDHLKEAIGACSGGTQLVHAM